MEIIQNKQLGFSVNFLKDKNEQIWMKGKDLAQKLGYIDTKKAISEHIPEKYKCRFLDIQNKGGDSPPIDMKHPQTTMISFPVGVSYLLGACKLPLGDKFREWLYGDVINSLYKTGKYETKPIYIRKNHQLMITDEKSLQIEAVNFLREHQNKYHLNIIATLGENQDTPDKRYDSKCLGYTKGSPDIIVNNESIHHIGLIVEFKAPNGNGELSTEQIEIINRYKDDGFKLIVTNNILDFVKRVTIWFLHLRLRCKYCSHKFKSEHSRQKHYVHFHHIQKQLCV